MKKKTALICVARSLALPLTDSLKAHTATMQNMFHHV